MKRSATVKPDYPVRLGILYGATGGFVAGMVMAPFLMLTAMMAGMPANTIAVAMGLAFGATQDNAMIFGFGMHMLTSILIGVIFGAVTAKVDRLRITGFGKGIIEGLIAGMIAFVVLFIPVSMLVMPPVLTQIVMQANPALTQQQTMSMLQQGIPLMMGMGVVEHLVYGAVLGAVASALALKVRRAEETRDTIPAASHHYECSTCHRKFKSVEEREDHIKTTHHGVAA
jgi:TM2 domain-containing membrane protein YozV